MLKWSMQLNVNLMWAHLPLSDTIILIMKTPERWRALLRRPPCQYFCPIDLLTHIPHIAKANYDWQTCTLHTIVWRSHHDVTAWHHVTSYVMTVSLHGPSNQKCRKITWRPWPLTLTFELVQDIIKVHTSTKFWVRTSNRSAVRALTDGQTNKQTDIWDRFYTLDRWRGRELHVDSTKVSQTVTLIWFANWPVWIYYYPSLAQP